MKKNSIINLKVLIIIVFLFSLKPEIYGQKNQDLKSKNDFFTRVQFGGGLGLMIGNRNADIMVSPSAIYPFNEYVSVGLGAQYSYIKQKDFYKANLYGGSIIALFHPLKEVQISTELEQLRVNQTFHDALGNATADFWNSALFVGVGYRNENITMGIRYNVLHKDQENVYTDGLMPFIRVFF